MANISSRAASRRTLTLRMLVLGITSVLSLIVLALCANLLWSAYQQYSTAERIHEVQRISDTLVKSGDDWDDERVMTINAMRDPGPISDAAMAEIRKHRADAEATFAKGVAMLKAMKGFKDQGDSLARTEEAKPKMASYRTALDANMAKPLNGRDPKLLTSWFNDMGAYISRTQLIRTRLEQSTVDIDGLFGILIGIEQTAWTGGEFLNREWFMMDAALDSGRPLSADEQGQSGGFRGRVEQALSLLRNYTIADNAPEEFSKEVERVDEQIIAPFNKRRAALLSASVKGGAYGITSDDWYKEVDRAHDALMGIAQKAQAAMARRANDLSGQAMWMMAQAGIVTLVGLLMAATGIWVAVARVSRPLSHITTAMTEIANGEKNAEVPFLDRGDEVGAMAQALDIFKQAAIEKDRLEVEQESQRVAQQQRQGRIENMIVGFDRQMQEVLNAVSSAATELQATAESMSGAAEETSRQATTVAAASEQASANVQTVAAAAEELAASVQEVGSQAVQSAQIAQNAVKQAAETDGKIDSLSDAVKKIGEVARLINDIASQTNLLALNATIEAARAGEAGKGFAVVASEVKNLASQTAKATEEISGQIGMVQAATSEVIQAITAVRNSISETNAVAASIASAVEEQSATTTEIAANTNQAASGTSEVSRNIEGMTIVASQTGAAANQVLSSASGLAQQAETLRKSVADFFEQVRAA
ncbi:MAG TPA: methyl-accepting chemotaxis protein [Alphaproteobacteria bacterium]|jgi:methyl-accepting chemotaxis protein